MFQEILSRFNREMDFYLTTSPNLFPPFQITRNARSRIASLSIQLFIYIADLRGKFVKNGTSILRTLYVVSKSRTIFIDVSTHDTADALAGFSLNRKHSLVF